MEKLIKKDEEMKMIVLCCYVCEMFSFVQVVEGCLGRIIRLQWIC